MRCFLFGHYLLEIGPKIRIGCQHRLEGTLTLSHDTSDERYSEKCERHLLTREPCEGDSIHERESENRVCLSSPRTAVRKDLKNSLRENRPLLAVCFGRAEAVLVRLAATTAAAYTTNDPQEHGHDFLAREDLNILST